MVGNLELAVFRLSESHRSRRLLGSLVVHSVPKAYLINFDLHSLLLSSACSSTRLPFWPLWRG